MTLKINVATQMIGAPIPGLNGAVYAGVAPAEGDCPQAHLVWWKKGPQTRQNHAASIELAKTVHPETNSHLITQAEGALLYATLRDQIDLIASWTSTYCDEDKDCAFVQGFYYGFQNYYGLSFEYRALAVSRLPL